MVENRETLAEQLAGVARALVAGDVYETLERITELAVDTIHACEYAGISLVVENHIEIYAQHGVVPARIARIQSEVGEGPCLDVIREHEVFATGDLAREQRWQRFSALVVEETGVRSLVSTRLFVDGETIGVLNLYATAVDAFDEQDRSLAAIFAAHGAVALEAAQAEQRLDVRGAGDTVDVVAKAKGLIMAHQDVDEGTALRVMQQTAECLSMALRDVANEVVARESDTGHHG